MRWGLVGLGASVLGFILVIVGLVDGSSRSAAIAAFAGLALALGGLVLMAIVLAAAVRPAIWTARQTADDVVTIKDELNGLSVSITRIGAAIGNVEAQLRDLEAHLRELETAVEALSRVPTAIEGVSREIEGLGASVGDISRDLDQRFDRVANAETHLKADLQAARRDVAAARSDLERSTKKLDRAIELRYRQLEALVSLESALDLKAPLPPMGGWALTPQAGLLLASHVITRRPSVTVEFGSGVSTILIARCLQLNGSGRLITFEHDSDFAELTRQLLESNDLMGVVELQVGDLEPVRIDSTEWLWYPMGDLDEVIDLVLVDGPPTATQTLARFPAMPLMRDRLAEGAVVILDDVDRSDEQEILERWGKAYPEDELVIRRFERDVAVIAVSRPGATS